MVQNDGYLNILVIYVSLVRLTVRVFFSYKSDVSYRLDNDRDGVARHVAVPDVSLSTISPGERIYSHIRNVTNSLE